MSKLSAQCDDCDRWKYRDRMRALGVGVDE